jgi:hypothetical protein
MLIFSPSPQPSPIKGEGDFPLVPKLQLGNEGMGHGFTGIEAGASAQLCSQAGAWEQEAKDLHPNPLNLGF